ncbi:hypothetical protein D3OALGB2SA_3221 [Olavius algarvensis associated proteobacterium Delta 3]|nr:hypothetical protein D3OALGB2SA_3221 [Olavius algarvensis associated proteobacterium Delta 3]
MGKAFRGEAVVNLPRASNNADHGLLLLARRVNPFQLIHLLSRATNCISPQWPSRTNNTSLVFLFSHTLKRVHATFGLGERRHIMSFSTIIPIGIGALIFLLSGLACVFVCSIFYSGLKGNRHNIGPTYGSGFGAHHPGGIILSDEERKALKDRYIIDEVIISY